MGCDVFVFVEEVEEDVFGVDVRVIECFCFFVGECEDFFYVWCVGNVVGGFGFLIGVYLFFDCFMNGFKIEVYFLKYVYGYVLVEFDEV